MAKRDRQGGGDACRKRGHLLGALTAAERRTLDGLLKHLLIQLERAEVTS
jgi:hypothetical protein